MISENTPSVSLPTGPYSNPSSFGLTCGIQFLTDFWREKYLQEYIRSGGSKIKYESFVEPVRCRRV